MLKHHRWRLILAVTFLAPMAIVKATELYLNHSLPQQVGAASSSPSSNAAVDPAIVELIAPAGSGRHEISDEQRQLLDYIDQVRRRPMTRSPLMRAAVIEETDSREQPEPEAPPEMNITVQAVMRSSGGNIALINGVSRTVGESIDDGRDGHWIIREIDPTARSVTFEHSSGKVSETRTVLR